MPDVPVSPGSVSDEKVFPLMDLGGAFIRVNSWRRVCYRKEDLVVGAAPHYWT